MTATDTQGWGVSPRGAGYLFGSDVVAQVIGRTHRMNHGGFSVS